MQGRKAIVAGFFLVAMQCGCDSPPTAKQPSGDGKASPAKAAQAVAQPAPTLPARQYASLEEAVSVLAEAAEEGDSEARNDATKYLISQGTAAIPLLAERLDQPDLKPRTAIAICRTLGQLGPAAFDPLVAALQNETSVVRVNAAEQLAILKPTNKQVVDKLIELIDHDDQQLRLIAIRGLAHLGKAAQRSSSRLQTLRNSKEENDTLRTAAGEALKKVDPRTSLVN